MTTRRRSRWRRVTSRRGPIRCPKIAAEKISTNSGAVKSPAPTWAIGTGFVVASAASRPPAPPSAPRPDRGEAAAAATPPAPSAQWRQRHGGAERVELPDAIIRGDHAHEVVDAADHHHPGDDQRRSPRWRRASCACVSSSPPSYATLPLPPRQLPAAGERPREEAMNGLMQDWPLCASRINDQRHASIHSGQ